MAYQNGQDNQYRRPPQRSGQSARPGTPASSGRAPVRQTQQRQAPAGTGAPRRTPENQPQQQRQQPVKNRWGQALLMVMATVVFCGFLAIFILQNANDLFGLNQVDQQIEIEVPEGSSIKDVAAILGNKGVIEHRGTFRIYAGLKSDDDDFQSGKYIFNSNMGYDEIIVALKSGNIKKEEVRITFIEGRTLAEIANLLEEKKVCDAEEFMEYLETAEFNYDFIDAIEDDPNRFRRLEGYIFPDTYDFYVGEKVDSVAKKFLRRFDELLTEDMREQMLERNMTIDEVVTLASVIQKEAGKTGDMRMVSSVFHNRLSNPANYPRLQSDVTTHYANYSIKPYLEIANQAMYDAYNTYVREGLPVGPICNPGMDAIEAVLTPTNSNYYFFVTDANEDFYYAETADRHYQNVAVAMRAEGSEDVHGIDTQ